MLYVIWVSLFELNDWKNNNFFMIFQSRTSQFIRFWSANISSYQNVVFYTRSGAFVVSHNLPRQMQFVKLFHNHCFNCLIFCSMRLKFPALSGKQQLRKWSPLNPVFSHLAWITWRIWSIWTRGVSVSDKTNFIISEWFCDTIRSKAPEKLLIGPCLGFWWKFSAAGQCCGFDINTIFNLQPECSVSPCC